VDLKLSSARIDYYSLAQYLSTLRVGVKEISNVRADL